MDQTYIERKIPHRPPFLFIDQIQDLQEDQIVATRVIRVEEPHFAGHYPGNPIMPGVLICEAAFQAAAVLLVHRLEKGDGDSLEGKTPVLSRITEAKFRAMVVPGDEITIRVRHKEKVSRFEFLDAVIEKNGKKAASLSFALALL